jgi:hypothetical protein
MQGSEVTAKKEGTEGWTRACACSHTLCVLGCVRGRGRVSAPCRSVRARVCVCAQEGWAGVVVWLCVLKGRCV